MEFSERMVMAVDRDWRFVRRHASRAWLRGAPADDDETVDLPHCWNERDTFQDAVAYYRGPGSYCRTVAVPHTPVTPEARWWLESDGFYGRAEVWINGRRVARQDGEYLGLNVDVTEHLRPGEPAVLGLRLTNRHSRNVLPGIEDPDFLLYGGLAGGLRLVRRPFPCLIPESLRVRSRPLAGGAWELSVAAAVASPAPASLELRWRLRSPSGELAAESVVAAGADSKPAACQLRVEQAQAWDVDHPALYTLEGELVCAGVVREAVRLRVGFRTAEFRPDEGFFLNGRRLELRGCNRHESMPGFGNALPTWLHEEDARLMRAAGLNFVRLSHYPQSPAFLDACDRLGLLVYAELATWKSVTARWGWMEAAVRQWGRMIARDRHHPSVVIWGMGNESRSRRAYMRLAAVARELDPEQRPVTYAENHLHRAVRRRTVGLPDVWGLNYEFGAMEAGRDASRLRMVLVTECSNEPATRRESLDAQIRQVRTLDADLARLAGKPWVAGYALWSFNDYATIRKGRQYRHCGIVDAWRQPKAAWAYLQARHAHEPFVSVWADWEERAPGTAGDLRTVCVLTNCSAVQVRVNGRETATPPAGNPIVLGVPFEPGELAVTGWLGERSVTECCPSWSAPVSIGIEAEPGVLRAGSGDVAGLRIRVVDAAGRTAAHWAGSLAVSVSGPARVRSYTPGDEVQLGRGIGRSFLQAGREAGVARVTVSGAGLAPASLDVRVVCA